MQDTREETNPQTVEPVERDCKEKDTLNKLADRIMSAVCSASGGHVAKKEKSIFVNAANVSDAVSGTL